MKNIFYFRELNECGGIESYFNYLVNKYDNDITIFFQHADSKQLSRLMKVVKCVKYSGEIIECDKAFFCFNREIWDKVIGKKYIVLHGDYEDMVKRGQLSMSNLPIMEDCDGYYGVSQTICDSFERLTGIKPINLYNPFIKPQQKKILRLVYCGRLTKEKGCERIIKLLNELDRQCVEYQMFIYSNGALDRKNVIQLPTQLDVANYLNKSNYDYLIQLSDNKSYCYSVVEALSNGLPISKTPLKVFDELGLNESNSIILEFDCSNVKQVVYEMLHKEFNFTYDPPQDKWCDVLVKSKRNYKKGNNMKIKLLKNVYDTQTKKEVKKDSVIEISNERGTEAIANGYAVEIAEEKIEQATQPIKEVKKAVKKTTKKK